MNADAPEGCCVRAPATSLRGQTRISASSPPALCEIVLRQPSAPAVQIKMAPGTARIMVTNAENTALVIACPSCGKAHQETMARLVSIDPLACPQCGYWIDLKGGEAAALIQKRRTIARADAPGPRRQDAAVRRRARPPRSITARMNVWRKSRGR
jgi:Zn-finger nucleic acid-binding protein